MKEETTFKYWHLVCIGFAIWIIGTWHGGWSTSPQSTFEWITDFTGGAMMGWGIAGDVLSNIIIQKGPIVQQDASAIRELMKED